MLALEATLVLLIFLLVSNFAIREEKKRKKRSGPW